MASAEEQKNLAEQLALASQLEDGDEYLTENNPIADAIYATGRGAIKGLDYPGGAIRSAIGLVGGNIRGKTTPEYKERIKKGLKFEDRFPTALEAAKKAGLVSESMPDTPEEIGGPMLLDMALSTAVDPLSYISMGGRVAKAGEAAMKPRAIYRKLGPNKAAPSGEFAAGAGAARSPMETADQVLGRQGLPGPGEQLLLGESDVRTLKDVPNEVVVGTPEEASDSLAKKLLKASQSVLQAPSRLTTGVGKRVYRGAFPTLDLMIPKKNRKDAVEQLYQAGVWGTGVSRVDAAGKAMEESGAKIGALLTEGTSRGGQVDLLKAIKGMERQADAFVADGLLGRDEADMFMSTMVGDYLNTSLTPSLDLAARWKTQVQRQLPEAAWNIMAKKGRMEEFRQLQKTFAKGLNDEILSEAERVLGKAGRDQLSQQSHLYGSLADSQKHVRSGAVKEAGESFLSPLDLGIMSGEIVHPAGMSGDLLAVKKAMDFGASPTVRTTAGTAIRKMGENPWLGALIDEATKRTILQQPAPNQAFEEFE